MELKMMHMNYYIIKSKFITIEIKRKSRIHIHGSSIEIRFFTITIMIFLLIQNDILIFERFCFK